MAGAQPAASGPKTVGTVFRISEANIYVDLGAHDQIAPGAKVELLEVLTVTNPKTGATMTSDFPLGRATVVLLGPNLCIVQLDDASVLKRLKVGDRARPVFAGQPRQYIDPWIVKPPPPPDPLTQKEAESLIKLVSGTLGKSLADKIRTFEVWAVDHETSPLGKDVSREIDGLRALLDEQRKAERELATRDAQRTGQLVQRLDISSSIRNIGQYIAMRPPKMVHESDDLHLAFLVLNPAAIGTARLYYRRAGESKFHRVALTRSGAEYLHGVIPAATIRAPRVDYFVEASSTTGSQPKAVFGTVEHPRSILVERRDDAGTDRKPGPRSQISMHMDYIDFDGFSKHDDEYWQAEFDFMYRFRTFIHAMRIGYGTLGGTAAEEANADYSYLYTELEFALSPWVALMLRPQFGTLESGADNDTTCPEPAGKICAALGLRARIRIGKEDGTHLVLGVSTAHEIGQLYEVLYNWPVIDQFPVQLSTQVTNQLNEKRRLRFVANIGWRRIPWIYPSLRISAQAEDSGVSGASGGLGLNFQW